MGLVGLATQAIQATQATQGLLAQVAVVVVEAALLPTNYKTLVKRFVVLKQSVSLAVGLLTLGRFLPQYLIPQALGLVLLPQVVAPEATIRQVEQEAQDRRVKQEPQAPQELRVTQGNPGKHLRFLRFV